MPSPRPTLVPPLKFLLCPTPEDWRLSIVSLETESQSSLTFPPAPLSILAETLAPADAWPRVWRALCFPGLRHVLDRCLPHRRLVQTSREAGLFDWPCPRTHKCQALWLPRWVYACSSVLKINHLLKLHVNKRWKKILDGGKKSPNLYNARRIITNNLCEPLWSCVSASV